MTPFHSFLFLFSLLALKELFTGKKIHLDICFSLLVCCFCSAHSTLSFYTLRSVESCCMWSSQLGQQINIIRIRFSFSSESAVRPALIFSFSTLLLLLLLEMRKAVGKEKKKCPSLRCNGVWQHTYWRNRDGKEEEKNLSCSYAVRKYSNNYDVCRSKNDPYKDRKRYRNSISTSAFKKFSAEKTQQQYLLF